MNISVKSSAFQSESASYPREVWRRFIEAQVAYCCAMEERDVLEENKFSIELAREIADAQDTSLEMASLRLGMYMLGAEISPEGKSTTGHPLDDCDQDGLCATYRQLSKISGFDPIAEWNATPGLS